MAQKDTEYEQLTQEIYQAINANTEFKNIDIKHNIKLEGKSGCKHQIDVYWEFEMMGEKHRVAIECKNYSNTVSVGNIRNFYGVLNDIGDIKGIFVTKVGFQSGAKKFADTYGISLKEMRFPADTDWKGRVRDMHLVINICNTVIKDRQLNLDINWILDNTSIKEGDSLEISGDNDKIKIVNSNRNEITNFFEIEQQLGKGLTECTNQIHVESFDNGYLISPSDELLKINSIKYVYDVVVHTAHKSLLEGDKVAKAILKDVATGEIKFYNIDGKIK